MKRWTNQCGCGNYMPDSYDECDYCKVGKYKLLDLIWLDFEPDLTRAGIFRRVAAALRNAEDRGRAEEKSRQE